MVSKPRDPLLGAAKFLVVLTQIVMIAGIVALAIGLGVILTIERADLLAEIAAAGAPANAIWLVVAAMLTGAALLYLGFRFFGQLRGIIDSVGAGDPFRPENADRLSRMGWIAVAVQVLILPVAALAAWFVHNFDMPHDKIHIDGGFDGGSILLTLILFILARVFREGAAMREELEGTV